LFTRSATAGEHSVLFYCFSTLLGLGEHAFQQVIFERHGVSAAAMRNEELAVTGERTVIEHNMVVVIIAAEGHFEFVEYEAGAVFGVAFGFFNFSNQTVVHVLLSFVRGNEKGTQEERAFQKSSGWMSVNTRISVCLPCREYKTIWARSQPVNGVLTASYDNCRINDRFL
jgi:hypothetical protein